MIIDGQAYWMRTQAQWVERVAQPIAQGRGLVLLPPDHPDAVMADADPALVQIVQGKLLGMCQSRGCAGVDLLFRADEPKHWCTSCGNAEIGGRWRPVRMPPESFLDAVDRIISLRPEYQRSWLTNQTIADLIQENVAHSDPVPDDLGALADDDEPYAIWLMTGRTD